MGLYEYVAKLYELYSFNTGKCSRYLSVESDIRKGCGAEQISDLLDMEVEQVREIIENE